MQVNLNEVQIQASPVPQSANQGSDTTSAQAKTAVQVPHADTLVTTTPPGDPPLTPDEAATRDQLVDLVLKTGVQAFIANQALQQIRERRLWRETHPSFEAFCREMLGLSEQRVSQLISAAEEYLSLKDKVKENLLPTNESALRSLRKVTPAKKVEVLELAARLSALNRPTGPAIQQAWEQLRGVESPSDAATKPKSVKPTRVLKAAQATAKLIKESSTDAYTLGELAELRAMLAQIQSEAEAKLPK